MELKTVCIELRSVMIFQHCEGREVECLPTACGFFSVAVLSFGG
jgi:hypothetical protein